MTIVKCWSPPTWYLKVVPYGCYDNYIVTLTTLGGSPVPNPITADFIGQTIIASVQDPSGNSCWGYIHYEDYLITSLQCGQVTLNCTSDVLLPSTDPLDSVPFPIPAGFIITPSTGYGPFIVADYDNCGDIDLSFTDQIVELDCTNGGLYTRIVYRTWTATDNQGNTTSCIDTINLRVPSLSGTNVFPNRNGTDAPSILCSGDWDTNNDGIPQPEEIGDELNMDCDVWGEYEDIIHPLTCGVLIDRDWEIVNMCTGEFISFIQQIRLEDDEPPVITCVSQLDASTNLHDCYATYHVPHPQIEDQCSEVTYLVSASSGTVTNIGTPEYPLYIIDQLEIGWHTVTFTAIDGCGNQASCTSDLHVQDLVPPHARCEGNLTIHLGAGQDEIDVDDINVYSSDACGIDYMKLRRVIQGSCDGTSYDDLQWHDIETFCCEEAGQTILIELGVWDIYGNFSSCIAHILVESNIAPSLTCPPDITVSCSFEFNPDDLSVFGSVVSDPNDVENIVIDDRDWIEYCKNQNYTGPHIWGQDGLATSNCEFTISEETEVNTECGRSIFENGVYLPAIIREFIISNEGGEINSCTQRIFIFDCNLQNTEIAWPDDVVIDACIGGSTDPADTGYPTISASSCDEISSSYTDHDAPATGDTCRHMVRHWVAVSDCATGADSIVGEHDQHIYIIKTEGLEISDCPDTIRADFGSAPINLVFNGDFEQGDTGFTSEYNMGGGDQNTYIVHHDPRTFNFDHACMDHTTGTGNMLIVDGSPTAGSFVWCQELNVQLGVEYTASAWVNNLITPADNFSDPDVQLIIKDYNDVIVASGEIPEIPDEWIFIEGKWIAPQTTTIEFCINTASTAAIGNDFAVDDILFIGSSNPCPLNPDNGCEMAIDVMPPSVIDCDSTYSPRWEITFNYDPNLGLDPDTSGHGAFPEYLPIGTHFVRWLAEDMCGNEVSCESIVILEDCESPVALCEDIGVQVVQDTNGITIYAEDIAAGSMDNCGDVAVSFLICQEDDTSNVADGDLYGLIDNNLVVIDQTSAQILQVIPIIGYDQELKYLTYVPEEELFFSMGVEGDIPVLVGIDKLGTVVSAVVLQYADPDYLVLECLAYAHHLDYLYASSKELHDPNIQTPGRTLVDINYTDANWCGATAFIPTVGQETMEALEFVDSTMYVINYDDSNSKLFIHSWFAPAYDFAFNYDPVFENEYDFLPVLGTSLIERTLYLSTENRELHKISLDTGIKHKIGDTHTDSEFNGKLLEGLAYVKFSSSASSEGINHADTCRLIPQLTFDCDDLTNVRDTFPYTIVVTDQAGNTDTCYGEFIVADSNEVCERSLIEIQNTINNEISVEYVKVGPNPFFNESTFYFRRNKPGGDLCINIYSVEGVKMHGFKVDGQLAVNEVKWGQSLNSGVYILEISLENTVLRLKTIKI